MVESAGQLSYDRLNAAVSGTMAAFRCLTEYQPAGGPGDKVFPPTYEGGKYAMEQRRLPGEEGLVDCVLLDSVQSQANRMELALLEEWERAKDFPLPVITVDFTETGILKVLRITSLEAPHRIADALLRDSLLDGKAFRESSLGKRLDEVDNKNATALFELCPTALVFGMWDSTGPKGGLGAKFARAMVSEIVGLGAQVGVKTRSRIDPAQILLNAGPLFKGKSGGWTLDKDEALHDKKGPVKMGKDGRPSEANHGNVTPSIAEGGVTIRRAIQTTVLSLPALRRLRFPVNAKTSPTVDDAARTALAALGLCAATLVRVQGCDLRSRCLLNATAPFEWELLDGPNTPAKFSLSRDHSIELYKKSVEVARKAGLPWLDKELVLRPLPQLAELVRKSQELAANLEVDEGGA